MSGPRAVGLGVCVTFLLGACSPAPAATPAPTATPTPAAAMSEFRDWTGDLQDKKGYGPIDGPEYADITAVTVAPDGDQIRIATDLAGPLPAQLDDRTLSYTLMIRMRRPGESEPSLLAKVQSNGGWQVVFVRLTGPQRGQVIPFPGGARFDGKTVTVWIDRSALDDPTTLTFQAATFFQESHFLDRDADRYASDLLPNDEAEFVAASLDGVPGTTVVEPAPTVAPTPTPIPPAPGTWVTIGRGQLIGLTMEDDMIVTDQSSSSFRRYDSDGILRGTAPMTKDVLDFGAWTDAAVDQRDDSIVLFNPDPGRAIRISSTTGEVTDRYSFDSGLYDFAIDGGGRMYLQCRSKSATCDTKSTYGRITMYGPHANAFLQGRPVSDDDARCSLSVLAMGPTTNGQIRAVMRVGGKTCPDNGTIQATDLGAELTGFYSRDIPFEDSHLPLDGTSLGSIAGSFDGSTLIPDMPPGTKSDDQFRLRWITADGTVKATWGHGGDLSGPKNPSAVALAEDGTMWVLDKDPGKDAGTVMFRAG